MGSQLIYYLWKNFVYSSFLMSKFTIILDYKNGENSYMFLFLKRDVPVSG